MPKPKHVQLLEILRDSGVGKTENISPFLSGIFEKPIDFVEIANTVTYRPCYLFIQDLLSRGLIGYDSNYELEVPYFSRAEGELIWFDKVAISVFITSKGLDYLDNYEETEINKQLTFSYMDTNKASKRSYSTQLVIGIITVVFAFVSAGISWINYTKTDTTAASVDSLRVEIMKWRLQEKKISSPITLSQERARKP